jgi:hypothetical protein
MSYGPISAPDAGQQAVCRRHCRGFFGPITANAGRFRLDDEARCLELRQGEHWFGSNEDYGFVAVAKGVRASVVS